MTDDRNTARRRFWALRLAIVGGSLALLGLGGIVMAIVLDPTSPTVYVFALVPLITIWAMVHIIKNNGTTRRRTTR
jgi:hypothetical protein